MLSPKRNFRAPKKACTFYDVTDDETSTIDNLFVDNRRFRSHLNNIQPMISNFNQPQEEFIRSPSKK